MLAEEAAQPVDPGGVTWSVSEVWKQVPEPIKAALIRVGAGKMEGECASLGRDGLPSKASRPTVSTCLRTCGRRTPSQMSGAGILSMTPPSAV